jgi:hypothetical protein
VVITDAEPDRLAPLAPPAPTGFHLSLPLERTYPVQEHPVALEQAQRAVQKVEEAEGVIGILPLVCQPLDQALLFVDVPFRSSNVLIGFGKVIAFANHVKAEQVWGGCRSHPRMHTLAHPLRRDVGSSASGADVCSAVMRPTVMGRRKRRGPALPGLKKRLLKGRDRGQNHWFR